MIDRLCGINIQGRCFSNLTLLRFFPNPKNRISIVYGRNGSGKSTISDGVNYLTQSDINSDINVKLIDNNDSCINYAPSDNKIFVFNENYINSKVKIHSDGLDTILLFGEAGEYQSEINQYELLKSNSEKEKSDKQMELEKYQHNNEPLNPEYHFDQIKKVLKQDNGWAEIDSILKGNKTKTSITAKVIDEIIKLTPQSSLDEIKKEFREKKLIYDKISTHNTKCLNPIVQIIYKKNLETLICELLSKQIKQSELTDREKEILKAVQSGQQEFIENAYLNFKSSSISTCPFCYQKINEEYKQKLIENIRHVLNKDVKEHKQQLHNIIFPNLNFNYDNYSEIDEELVDKINTQKNICQDLINQYKELINQKLGNIYTPINIDINGLVDRIVDLNTLLKQLENKRLDFNESINKKDRFKKELINLNKEIAYYQILDHYKSYKKQEKEKHGLVSNIEQINSDLNKIESHIKELKGKMSKLGLAVNYINKSLNYIFMDSKRISIELKNQKYYLKVNGENVTPNKVSLGERNIIALCYFFTQIMDQKDMSKPYNDESLIIIDDPISSFDFENRIGITSYLKYEIDKIIRGNKNSKVLILSHDLSTIFDLQKIMEEINKVSKEKSIFLKFELSNGKLSNFERKRNEYQVLLQKIYNYACDVNQNDDNNIIIGNIMRRVLEAFSTFSYQKSIEEVSYNKIILNKLGKYSSYFQHLMYRLVLHGESHYEEQVYTMRDGLEFHELISDDSKKKTAKDILCFIYLLNEVHIQSYLGDKAINNIKRWLSNIEKIFSTETTIEQTQNKKSVDLYELPSSAGMGLYLDNIVPHREYLTDNKECDFALKISGNSMEPDVPDNSIVLVKQCKNLDDGKIGIFILNGSAFCKKITHKNNNAYLESINPKYKPIKIIEYDSFKTFGEVIEVCED